MTRHYNWSDCAVCQRESASYQTTCLLYAPASTIFRRDIEMLMYAQRLFIFKSIPSQFWVRLHFCCRCVPYQSSLGTHMYTYIKQNCPLYVHINAFRNLNTYREISGEKERRMHQWMCIYTYIYKTSSVGRKTHDTHTTHTHRHTHKQTERMW